MFNGRRRFSMGETARGSDGAHGLRAISPTERSRPVAVIYVRHASLLEHIVSRAATGPPAVLEDACQTAWAQLCARSDVEVEVSGAFRWLVVTAVREAWRSTTRNRELPVGGWLPEVDAVGELREPRGDAPDPVHVAVERDHLRRRLLVLTPRERQF